MITMLWCYRSKHVIANVRDLSAFNDVTQAYVFVSRFWNQRNEQLHETLKR